MQLALGADAIRIVAAVDMAQVEGRHVDGEQRIAVLLLQLVAPSEHFADAPMHALERADAQGGVAGMARERPVSRIALHGDALVQCAPGAGPVGSPITACRPRCRPAYRASALAPHMELSSSAVATMVRG